MAKNSIRNLSISAPLREDLIVPVAKGLGFKEEEAFPLDPENFVTPTDEEVLEASWDYLQDWVHCRVAEPVTQVFKELELKQTKEQIAQQKEQLEVQEKEAEKAVEKKVSEAIKVSADVS